MKKSSRTLALMLALMLVSAPIVSCTNKGDTASNPTAVPTSEADTPAAVGIRLAAGGEFSADGDIAPEQTESINYFAHHLLNAFEEDGTFVASPVSLSIVLQMLANGADDHEKSMLMMAVGNVLGFDEFSKDNSEEWSEFFTRCNENAANLIKALLCEKADAKDDKNSVFTLDNAILVQKGDRFNSEFEAALSKYFKASVGNIDFANTKEALEIINGWVNEKTNSMIPQLLDDISPDTAMALINALYFKGTWAAPFKAFCDPMVFNGAHGEKEVTMLNRTADTLYGEIDGAGQTALVPYADGKYYMAVVLPDDGVSPARALNTAIADFDTIDNSVLLTLNMPAVKLDTKLDMLKMLDKFSELKGLTDVSFPGIIEGSGINVAQFVHGASITVTETGTEAAAASAIIGNKGISAAPKATMTCDRPYAMAIVHAETGAVVFTAVINDVPEN